MGAFIMARSPTQTLDGLRSFLAWQPIGDVSELQMEMVAYATALSDLCDEGHDIADELQSCAPDAVTKKVRKQPKHVLDLGLWWAQSARTSVPADKLNDQLVAIETTIHNYASCENTVASSALACESMASANDWMLVNRQQLRCGFNTSRQTANRKWLVKSTNQSSLQSSLLRLSITTMPSHEPTTSTSRRYLQLNLASLSAIEELT
jgi:hypothetical protein